MIGGSHARFSKLVREQHEEASRELGQDAKLRLNLEPLRQLVGGLGLANPLAVQRLVNAAIDRRCRKLGA